MAKRGCRIIVNVSSETGPCADGAEGDKLPNHGRLSMLTRIMALGAGASRRRHPGRGCCPRFAAQIAEAIVRAADNLDADAAYAEASPWTYAKPRSK